MVLLFIALLSVHNSFFFRCSFLNVFVLSVCSLALQGCAWVLLRLTLLCFERTYFFLLYMRRDKNARHTEKPTTIEEICSNAHAQQKWPESTFPHLSLALRVFACVTYIKEFVLSCLSLFTFVFFLFLCYVVAFVRQHHKQNTAKRWESVKEKYLK